SCPGQTVPPGTRFSKRTLCCALPSGAVRNQFRAAKLAFTDGLRPPRAGTYVGVGDDYPEMGADLPAGLDRGRRSRIHRSSGCLGRHRPLPVLRLRRDLPGAADTGAHGLQGVAEVAPAFSVVM